MNRWTRTLCAGIAITAALTVSAFAANFTECAEHLQELGLFRGTTQGYELDRTPTRAEAATMLVRLLGKESEAEALTYSAPFTDLQEWEKPYVQYLYDNGLTTGATAVSFQPEQKCTAQMYAAFLLRALGYTEAQGDFAYAEAVSFAERLGIYDASIVDTENFLRDHVAAASYTALSVSPKEAEGTLLDQLVDEDAVSASRAKPYQELFIVYNRYLNDTKGMTELTALSVQQELKLDAGSFTLSSSEQSSIDLKNAVSLTSRVVTLSADSVGDKTFTAQSYTANGCRYVRQNGTRARYELSNAQKRAAFAGYARVSVALIEKISSSGRKYTIAYSKAGLARWGSLLEAVQTATAPLADMQATGLTVTQTISSGRITAQSASMDFTAGSLSGSVESTATLLGVNGEVKITAPSGLEQYPLVS